MSSPRNERNAADGTLRIGSKLKACESSLEGLDETIFQGWEPVDNWSWDLAPSGELEKDYALSLRVKAWKL